MSRRTTKPAAPVGAGPAGKLDELAGDGLKEARSVLLAFTRSGMAQRKKRPVDFNDPMQVAALEVLGKISSDPQGSASVGAWMHRLKDRGAGHFTPLHGASEGLHVLVLDAPAVAELWEAMAAHRAAVEKYGQLQADLAKLARLRRMRGAA